MGRIANPLRPSDPGSQPIKPATLPPDAATAGDILSRFLSTAPPGDRDTLASLAAVWPRLPAALKAGILAMVKAADSTKEKP